jgi:hypothetical protein
LVIDADNDSPETKKNPMRKMAKTIAIKVLVPILNDRVERITPDLCYQGIIRDESIWGVSPMEFKGEALNWLKKFSFLYKRFEKSITADLLLECWMKPERPDLYAVVTGYIVDGQPVGKIWFEKQVEDFKKQFNETLG